MEEGRQPTASEPSSPPMAPPRQPPSRRPVRWKLGGLLLVAVACAAGYWFLSRPAQLPDPRLTFPTRYRNVRPDVAYVGDARCLECHNKEAEHFRQHPMGRSLAPESTLLEHEEMGPEYQNPFTAAGLHYQVIKRDNTLWHRETMLDDNKAVVYEKEVPIHYALGSGKLGRSYLHTRDGQVWQSPISWYSSAKPAEKGRWDLSPSYSRHNLHFERPASADCLNCHANQVDPIPGTTNQYQEPLFQGYTIGCERCHGPGQLHVNNPHQADTIVNPVHLEPVLREAVCQQCHLIGEQRINRIGRNLSEYRPGLPLHAFISVAVPSDKLDGSGKAVGQVEQMHSSVCFQKSAGKLGCISCHFHPDSQTPAHQPVAREHSLDYFRQRCLSCHDQSRGCSEPMTKRQAQHDSCVACHMPLRTSSDVAHVSLTDHTISRRPNVERGKTKPLSTDEFPLVLFHSGLEDTMEFTRDRDLAIVLIWLTNREQAPYLAQRVKPLLEASLTRFPDDIEGLEALSQLQWLVGEQEESFQTLTRVLNLSPRPERPLRTASARAILLQRSAEALALTRRLVEINPNDSGIQLQLARLLQEKKQFKEALEATQAALQLNPANREVRKFLMRCYLDLGQKDLASTELAKYLAFKPPDADLVKIWFDP